MSAHHCPRCGHDLTPRQQPLTRHQAAVLAFVREHITAHGYAPSFTEIAVHFRYASLSTVHEHLQNIERKGYITRGFNECRSIALVDSATSGVGT